ncbi:hypothetical protein QBC32DRAFT_373738 [Pseudoneurospora amorphoporcata]|uniref:Uncharacterized protein n=1 Tax=Pseudoneurospora amorphoporcata TaxID=241081 RepID=A0AAN6NM95_9PEZI|nr:hypothetical protein QBC32DRAFT_373738 [Pseudoneurospora amorphoporcata]
MDIYTDPKFNSLDPLPDVLANLTFWDITVNIPDNCTCAPVADFLGYLEGSFASKTLKDEGDMPVSKFSTLVRNCTTPGLLDDVSNGQIIDWYFNRSLNDDSDFGWLYLEVAGPCFHEYCNALTWEGNPDISGIGVNIAFFIQAILTSIFLFIYKITSLWRKAADDCLQVFWSTCFVFALTLAAGTLCFNVIYHSPGHVYSGYFGYLGTVLSVAALVCLWPWFPGRYQYPVLTFSGVSVLVGLVIGVGMTFLKEVSSDDKTVFERACLESRQDLTGWGDSSDDHPFFEPTQSTTYVQNFVRYTPYATLTLLITNWNLYKMITGILGGLLVLGSFALVWIAFSFFFYLRIRVESLAGPSYAENEWGFGQIVAIAAWLPLFGQIGMVVFRTTLKDTKYQKWFNPAPESERYSHHLLTQSPTFEQLQRLGTDLEKKPVTTVAQQDITDAWQR